MSGQREEPCTVLIAEDDSHTRNLLREVCESWGFQTLAAADGEEALALARGEARLDLVLLDLMMPKLDGFEVLRRLRAGRETREVAVMVLTAIGDVDGKLKGIELGADDYVTKPFRLAELQRRIDAVLDKRRYRDQLRAERAGTHAPLDPYPDLKEALERGVTEARESARPLAALCVVVDGYPLAYEGLEPQATAKVLSEVEARLQSTLRESDGVFRIDVDTFVLLMPDTTCEAASRVAERLQRLVEQVPMPFPGPKAASISVGIAGFPRFGLEKPDDLVRAANQALLQVKRQGSGQVGQA